MPLIHHPVDCGAYAGHAACTCGGATAGRLLEQAISDTDLAARFDLPKTLKIGLHPVQAWVLARHLGAAEGLASDELVARAVAHEIRGPAGTATAWRRLTDGSGYPWWYVTHEGRAATLTVDRGVDRGWSGAFHTRAEHDGSGQLPDGTRTAGDRHQAVRAAIEVAAADLSSEEAADLVATATVFEFPTVDLRPGTLVTLDDAGWGVATGVASDAPIGTWPRWTSRTGVAVHRHTSLENALGAAAAT